LSRLGDRYIDALDSDRRGLCRGTREAIDQARARLSADEWQLAYREGKELGTDVVLASFVR
jgi:hypothetical protein